MRTIKEGDTVIVETIVPFGPHHMKKTLARVVHTPANSGDLLYFETMLSHAPFAVNPQASAFTGMSLMPFNEVPPDLPNVKEIVQEWLRRRGYDGLCNPDADCGCSVDDVFACGYATGNCVPAVRCKCEDGEDGCFCPVNSGK